MNKYTDGNDAREAAGRADAVPVCTCPSGDGSLRHPCQQHPPADPAARAQAAVGDGDGLVYGIIDPDYARIFTIARAIAWSEGYALAMHGSFTRDLDLIAIPWADRICEPAHLARRIADSAGLKDRSPKNPSTKPHGRLAWTLHLPGFGDPRWVDLSVVSNAHPSPAHAGAGDADNEYSRIYAEVIKVCADQPMAHEIASRLAGGDHA